MIRHIYTEEFHDYIKSNSAYNAGHRFYIYKNPTEDEYRKYVCDWSRGFIDKDGNIYLEGYEDKLQNDSHRISNIMHVEMLDALGQKLRLPKDFATDFQYEYQGRESNYGIAISLDQDGKRGNGNKKTKVIILSELYFQKPEDYGDESHDDVALLDGAEYRKIIAKCKVKNPALVFETYD